jgi:hypothetical protein
VRVKPTEQGGSVSRLFYLSVAVGILAIGFCQWPHSARAGNAEVPAAYQPLFATLKAQLDAAAGQTGAPSLREGPVYSTDLLVANSNRGPALLLPETLEATKLFLDRFKAMGIGCVKFALQYPLLRPDFPRSEEYLAFYKAVE